MGTIIDPVDKAWMAPAEFVDRLRVTAGEAGLLPDFIEAAGVAGVAAAEHTPGNSQPTGDPDVDGVLGCQSRAGWRPGGLPGGERR